MSEPEQGPRLVVGEDEAGERLDVFLARRIEGIGRAAAKRLVADGEVRVDGKRAPKGSTLVAGATVSLERTPERGDFSPLPDPDLPLHVRHEDDDYLVVDKPAGMPSHPLRAGERGTLANAIVARYPEAAGFGRSRRDAGLLQRLDTDTSGIVLVARSRHGAEALVRMLAAGEIDKRYLALTEGEVRAPQLVDLAVGHDPRDERRMVAVTELEASRARSPRVALTEIVASERRGRRSLVEARARSARRHQVRVHLAAIGHPLVGDALYGGPALSGFERHFLHASMLAFRHVRSGERVVHQSPLPEELEAALAREGFHR